MPLPPFVWKDRPALIETLLPVQKLSIESFKEQMAGSGKTLTALGSYWKGRKPLVLNKACILGCLLPATDNPVKDLHIFELLMGMDDRSLAIRLGHIKPTVIAERVSGLDVARLFTCTPPAPLPPFTPFRLADYPVEMIKAGKTIIVIPKLKWRDDVAEDERLEIEAHALPPNTTYRERVSDAKRAEEVTDTVQRHIWPEVNAHLGTQVRSFPELVEQMGIARFGHRPRLADVFCGSGQIPFEAGRLGCDVYASDLNPIACMLTWGAFNIVGASPEKRHEMEQSQQELAVKVQTEIDVLGIEQDGHGWRAKVYLYCVEVCCPQSGWMVPLLPTLIISKGYRVIARLKPVSDDKRYDIAIEYVNSDAEIELAKVGTVNDGELVHSPDGVNVYRTKISTLRGDYTDENGENRNRLRLWEKLDFVPRPDDIYQERLYCVQWMRPKSKGKGCEYKFRAVTAADLEREQSVITLVREHLADWQEKGWVPDMRIESGYNTDQPVRERGWTHWHHLFNPRQLLVGGMVAARLRAYQYSSFTNHLNYCSKLCRWDSNPGPGRTGKTQGVFDNQALNTLLSYACRSFAWSKEFFHNDFVDIAETGQCTVESHAATDIASTNDLYISDPPYGDAVKYEEILEFFIAWLRKNPPPEFARWTWDSRRALAIKGEDEDFRQGMIASYKATAQHMPDNGIQVLMFTHQSGSIWADMATIVWGAGLRVTAAWYVVTETDSALRDGAHVKGTILLVLRKRAGGLASFRDDLGWEIESAVKDQVALLTGLDKSVRSQGAEALYTDADIQMAGYAAALKVLTTYGIIDGKDMEKEAAAPRRNSERTFVDELIDFAVQTAVQFLIPRGFDEGDWKKLSPAERYYLKMLDLEAQGLKTLDNYQNFAKAYRVKDFRVLMAESKANHAKVKTAAQFKGNQMDGGTELAGTPLRAVLYALWELQIEHEIDDVLAHLMENDSGFMQHRALLIELVDYVAGKRAGVNEAEAAAARILAEALKTQGL